MTQLSTVSLEATHKVLGWPAQSDVMHPVGSGAAVYASLAKEKIGRSLALYSDANNADIGVLMPDSGAETSEPPLAIVIVFQNEVSENTLRELHRLCWNFSHAPTLFTLEPNLLRSWTCCEAPNADRKLQEFLVHDLPIERFIQEQALENKATQAIHWINLVSGQFFSEREDRFNRDGRADQMLLSNLRYIRKELWVRELQNDDVCHDLLARIIFVQFLFDRKDNDGNPALTESKLLRLNKDGVLKKVHTSFDGLLSDYDETYRLFDWLNTKFNGDLFPGKGDTEEARAKGWEKEKSIVNAEHLSLLGGFIRGDADMSTGQGCLWPQYAFDVIPLEFISSIYETFVTERASQDGIFYTPPYLVDFILDRILPWDSSDWNLKIIDPACGSGVFLVKAFQRLVHRWKNANPSKTIRAETLRRLLEKNIFGVDKDSHAVRVACFSLYLAMCDEIEPRHYWTQITFPTMRGQRLICSDFFDEEQSGFDTKKDSEAYDLVVGNAPWGGNVITEAAKKWASSKEHTWTITNKDIGGLFLAKCGILLRKGGRVAMIQSANSLLFNIGPTAIKFRQQLFSTYSMQEIYNLSAIRFKVFKRKSHTTNTSSAPVCVIFFEASKPPKDSKINYISPKHLKPLVDEFTIVIEPQDRCSISNLAAISDSSIWSVMMWGGARDRQLIKKLQSFPSLESLKSGNKIVHQQGITYGDKSKSASHLEGMRIFDESMFPEDHILFIDNSVLPIANDIKIHSRASTSIDAFSCPQLIIKQSWKKHSGRFHAKLNGPKAKEGILCNQSYLSIHADQSILDAACVSHNSLLAVYYHFLTSGRFAAYRPKLSVNDILQMPIPNPRPNLTDGIETYQQLDASAFDLFTLNDAERALIEDAIDYTLADFLDGPKSKGRTSTVETSSNSEIHLKSYCSYFMRVLKAGFGEEKPICATIFTTPTGTLPYRLISFSLGHATENEVSVSEIQSSQLIRELERLNLNSQTSGGIFNERVARIYDASDGVPTVFMIKPDEKRFWTRSTGLKDGDDVALDLFKWQLQPIKTKGT